MPFSFTTALAELPAWLEQPSVSAAVAISVVFGALFVASIYLVSAIFAAPDASVHDRNHPHVVKQRIRGAAIATAVSLGLSALLLRQWGQKGVVASLGLDPARIAPSVLVATVLTATIYLGPLVLDYLDGGVEWASLRRVPETLWNQPLAMRNFVVGPVTEELVFRSSVVSLWAAAGMSANRSIFLSPLIFGLAHIHHAVSQYRDGRPLKFVLFGTTFQFVYTTLFGWFAVALFVRTKSIAGPICAHAFCNYQGLPDFSRAEGHPQYKYLVWLAFGVGLCGFAVLFEPMTREGVFV
ncbi:CAAX prenyl protease [Coemansia sp. RSA 2599]|nr:CAAX prenyl protease [Coemansia sp. RSA 2598]KAJ1828988.1 CAAX prenyl protease [Coemansia sp. RSA 2599]